MAKQTKQLYDAIDSILWNDWDPIGINGMLAIRDEYTSYVPYLVRLKKEDADVHEIANHLNQLETSSMGMDGSLDRCKEIAQKIKDL